MSNNICVARIEPLRTRGGNGDCAQQCPESEVILTVHRSLYSLARDSARRIWKRLRFYLIESTLLKVCVDSWSNHDTSFSRCVLKHSLPNASRRKPSSDKEKLRHSVSAMQPQLPSVPHLAIILLVMLLATSTLSLAARAGRSDSKDEMELRCPPCRQIHCAIRDPKQLGCKGGVTTGVCGCCPACARLSGETCGGDLSYLGKCDRGLSCVAAPQPSPSSTHRMQREPPGICTARRQGAVPTSEQADEAATTQCKPRCTQHFCSRRPRAVCSASKGTAETTRPCQGNCQHTSCRACAMVDDVECVRCAGHDFRCLKQFGRCVARQRCRGKAGRKYCKRLRLRGNVGRRFVCQVPECPS